jgi:hypothetical protein
MASTDARPVPRKNVAFRYYFPIRNVSGTALITTWAGQDSEVSLDGGAFTDCTNEATEIGTSGCGYIDLTADEMNADAVVLKTTVTNTGAVPVVVTFFPEEAGDVRCDTVQIAGAAVASSSAQIGVNVVDWKGATAPAMTGDAFARLGSPSQGSVIADLALVASNIQSWIADVTAKTDLLTFNGDNDVIASLDAESVTLTAPAQEAIVTATWAALTSALTGAGTIGKLLADNINATISSRSTYAGVDTAGTTTLLERLTATRAGYLDAAVSSRLAASGYMAPDNTSAAAAAATAAKLDTALEQDGAVYRLTANALELAPAGEGGAGADAAAIVAALLATTEFSRILAGAGGNMTVDQDTGKLRLLADDGVTVLATFDLTDTSRLLE